VCTMLNVRFSCLAIYILYVPFVKSVIELERFSDNLCPFDQKNDKDK
jgi:hypothetical protein